MSQLQYLVQLHNSSYRVIGRDPTVDYRGLTVHFCDLTVAYCTPCWRLRWGLNLGRCITRVFRVYFLRRKNDLSISNSCRYSMEVDEQRVLNGEPSARRKTKKGKCRGGEAKAVVTTVCPGGR